MYARQEKCTGFCSVEALHASGVCQLSGGNDGVPSRRRCMCVCTFFIVVKTMTILSKSRR